MISRLCVSIKVEGVLPVVIFFSITKFICFPIIHLAASSFFLYSALGSPSTG